MIYNSTCRDFFTDPKTGVFYKENDIITNPKLANTLKVIAREGSDAIYGGGSLAQKLVDEIQNDGGIITMEDFKNFKPKWGKAFESKLFNGDSLFTHPLPTTGHVLNFVMRILDGFNFHEKSLEQHNQEKLFYHRIAEAFKFGFAKRAQLGNEMMPQVLQTLIECESLTYSDHIRTLIWDNKTFDTYEYYGATANISQLEDHGTGHISILAPNGDAVALTTTINDV